MPHRRPVFITPGRHPFEIAPLAACAVSGTVMSVSGLRPPSVLDGYPEPIVITWLALIGLGGIIGIVGAFWRGNTDDGLLVELLGVAAVAGGCLLYVAALYATRPIGSAFAAGGLLTGLAIGASWRSWQCWCDWRKVRSAEVSNITVELPLLTEPADLDDPEGRDV